MEPTFEQRVEEVIADYLLAIDAGCPPSRAELFARYPDLAEELGEFLDDMAHFGQFATPRLSASQLLNDAGTATFTGQETDEFIEGKLLISDYQLLGEIARGGMGIVYRCRDSTLQRDLAVKVLQKSFMSRPLIVQRFLEEARIAGQLQHPGIVPIHAVGKTDDGRPYFTMKLVRGRTLSDLLRERHDPSHDLSRFLKIFEQIAQTIAYAHSCRVIHRDLKPANVMVGAFGEVQVMDWGLAKPMDQAPDVPDESALLEAHAPLSKSRDQTHAGAIIGTPSYMAPEQARGETNFLNERADVFGLGAILCEILTGKPPFHGEDRINVLLQAQLADLNGALARLAECGADDDLRNLAIHCLAPDAVNRPASASVVAEAITTYLTGVQERLHEAEVARAAAQARAEEAVRARTLADQKRRLGIALALTLMGIVTLGVGGWFWIDRDKAIREAAKTQALQDQAKRGEEELHRALQLRDEAKAAGGENVAQWAAALAVAKRAEGFVANEELDSDLRHRVAQLLAELEEEKRDRELYERLREVRWHATEDEQSVLDSRASAGAYAAVFRSSGVEETMTPEAIKDHLAQRTFSEHFATALFDWSRLHADPKVGKNLQAAADLIDPSPERSALREEIAKSNPVRLLGLGKTLNVAKTAPLLICFVADALAKQATLLKTPNQQWFQSQPFQLAIDLLRRGQAQYPQDFWVNHQLGYWLLKTQQPQYTDDTIRFFTAAVSIYNRSAGAYLNLGRALWRKSTYEAIKAASDAVRLKPDYPSAYDVLVGYLLWQGRTKEASEYAQLGITNNPKSAITRTAVGRVVLAQEQFQQAIVELQAATQLDSCYRPAWVHLAHTFNRLNKLDQAIESMRQAMKLNDKMVDDQIFLGILLGRKGEVDEALSLLQQASKARPNDNQIALAINDVWNKKTQGNDTIPQLREVIKRNPQDADALLKLARLEAAAGESRTALEHLGMARQLRPNDATVHHQAALLQMTLGNHEAALNAMYQAEHVRPDDLQIRLDLGRAQLNAGLLVEAQPNLERVIKDKPLSPWAYHYLSLLYERQGNFPKALKFHQEALTRRKNDFVFAPRHEEQVKYLEQQAALAEKVDAVLQGNASLDPSDRLAFAKLCVLQQKYVSATKFFTEAMADNPDLVADATTSVRPAAASAAVRAGLGRGTEEKKLTDAERKKYFQTAFDWLNQELTLAEKQLPNANQTTFFGILHYMLNWSSEMFDNKQFDFGALPPGVREQWQTLWKKIDEQTKQARKRP
jgi:tetratricopeptide (TPR) repeat protein/tRNA A-37 threonylcarbamoyl transferase component Bud32